MLHYIYSTLNTLDTTEGLFVRFARVGSGDPVRLLHLFHNKYMQGLIVPFARVGSGDPVRVLCLLLNNYAGYS